MGINLVGSTSQQADNIIDFIYSWYTSTGIKYTNGVKHADETRPFISISENMRVSKEQLLEFVENNDFRTNYLHAIEMGDDDEYGEYIGYIPNFLSHICPVLKSVNLDGQERLSADLTPVIEQFFRNYTNDLLVKPACK